MAPKSAELAVVAPPSEEPKLPEVEARRIDLVWSASMVVAIGFLFLLLSLFQGVAVPVLLALAVAYALNPVVTWLAERGVKRPWGTTMVFVVLTLMLAGLVLYLIPVLRDEAAKVPVFFQKAAKQLSPWVESRLGISVPELLRHRAEELGDEAASVVQSAGPTVAKLAAAFAGNTARVIATALGLLMVPVLGFFFLMDYPRLVQMGLSLVPRKAEALVTKRFAEVDEVLSAFVRGQLTVGAILSVLYSTGLSIARVDMAIVIGLIAGFGNMVPYLGTGVGILLASLGLILNYQGPWQVAVVALTFVVAQAAEGLVITPRVVGEKVGLPAVAVIVAVLGFGELFGFVGILLAVPTAAILKVVGSVVVARYQKTAIYTGEASGA